MFYMGSTKISPEKTASEIQQLLGKNGAQRILFEYDSGEIIGISFSKNINSREIAFRVPIRWQECLQAMLDDPSTPDHYCKEDQAQRTAWRNALRWLQSQFAFMSTRMVKLEEIMLPYAQTETGKTLFEQLAEKGFKALPSPEE